MNIEIINKHFSFHCVCTKKGRKLVTLDMGNSYFIFVLQY